MHQHVVRSGPIQQLAFSTGTSVSRSRNVAERFLDLAPAHDQDTAQHDQCALSEEADASGIGPTHECADFIGFVNTAGLVPTIPDITNEFNVAVAGPVASFLGSLPLVAGFELHARIGYLFAHQDMEQRFSQPTSFGNDAWIGGVGATWSFAERWAVRFEYLRTTDLDGNERLGESRLEMLSLGALFRL
jgi:hypothetical protein